MEPKRVIRKLAAIIIADVVGFSRHMERDDAGTLARLREIREQLIDPKISEYGGHVVKTAGDGMLLEFSSADAALPTTVLQVARRPRLEHLRLCVRSRSAASAMDRSVASRRSPIFEPSTHWC
jgi:class 3 adenylate cyclase